MTQNSQELLVIFMKNRSKNMSKFDLQKLQKMGANGLKTIKSEKKFASFPSKIKKL